MKIAFNTRLLIKDKLDGIGWFTYQTLKRISLNHPEHEFIFFFDREFDPEFVFSKNVKPVVISPPARHPLLWFIWFEWSLRRQLRKLSPDLFVSPDGFLSLLSSVPAVTMIHDINFHHRPFDLPFFTRKYYRYFFPRFAKKAILLGTVSEYSKNDIIKSYNVEADNIGVIYNGAHESFKPLDHLLIKEVRNNYSSGLPFFIFVGSLHPRKNIINMLRAFDNFRGSTDRFKLIVVGNNTFMTRHIDKIHRQMQFSSDVIFTGRLDQEELALLMGSAEALVFIPFFEGFGIPLVEAMCCEIPILASNITSIPEIAGDAAIYADPSDIKGIAAQMKSIANDKTIRNRLIEAGRRRRLEFNWDYSARKFWELIEEAYNKIYNA